ncbi:MAG: glycosyltransferase family 2 protein [Cryomorphaceae bacterium]|nr:glycosyltransferase family 2 protein [Cryomorphaceae bacterium]
MKWTLLVPTFNEAACLERCLASAIDLADELLIVDSFSTDETLAIAQRFGARIVQREYVHSASQKNWAIPQAHHPWILLLDADEWLSPTLYAELKAMKEGPEPQQAGFWIYRANHFLGQRVRYSGWQGDKVIRLFQRDACRYQDQHVHAEIIAKGPVGKLQGRLNHDTYKGIAAWEAKLRRYAQWQALDYDGRTGRITWVHCWLKPGFRFFKQYVLRLGFLDGAMGFTVSKYAAWAVRLRYEALAAYRRQKS